MLKNENIIDTFISRVDINPEGIAFAHLSEACEVTEKITNRQLHTRSVEIAGKLQSLTVQSDKILLLLPQGLEFVKAFMGVLYSGTVPVIMSVPNEGGFNDSQISNIKSIVNEANISVILTSLLIIDDIISLFFRSASLSSKIIIATEDTDSHLIKNWKKPLFQKESIAYFQRTSAVFGKPKYVMISHEIMMNTHACIEKYHGLTSSSCSVSWLPHYHYLGLIIGIIQPIYTGYIGYLFSQYVFLRNPIIWLKAISQYKASISGAPNFAYKMCNDNISVDQYRNFDLTHWDVAFNSAEYINQKTPRRFFEKFKTYGLRDTALTSIYGLAESAYVTTRNEVINKSVSIDLNTVRKLSSASKNKNNLANISSCGLPVPDTEVLIVDPKSETECKEYELGEIWVKSKCNAIGYWNQPNVTSTVFSSYTAKSNKGPYLRTGDFGYIKEGEIHIVNKANNMDLIE